MTSAMSKNMRKFEEICISKKYPIGTYVGILEGEFVAAADSSTWVKDRVAEVYFQQEREPGEIPAIVKRIGLPEEPPQVLPIEVDSQQVAFHSSQPNLMQWSDVAKPIHNELVIDPSLDKNFMKFRLVAKNQRPYVTLVVDSGIWNHGGQFGNNGGPFLMTFFLDTGAPANFIKTNVFGTIRSLYPWDEDKFLMIQGQKLHFSKSPSNKIHSNINVIGLPTMAKLPALWKGFYDFGIQYREGKVEIENGRETDAEINDWR
jgi:hypothetical protein